MPPSEEDLAASYRDGMGRFATNGGGEFRGFPGVTCFRNPLPFVPFNMAFVEDPTVLNRAVLDAVHAFYREMRTEWSLVVPPGHARAFETTLKHIAVSSRLTMPEMILPREADHAWPSPPNLQVRRIRDLDELRDWMEVASIAYGMGDPRFFDRLASPAALDAPGMAHFIGLMHGRPVATSSLYIRNGVAGVHGVSTLPEVRGKGFGAAMSAAVVRDGFSHGCHTVALQATPSGFPVYFRMGFRHVFDFEEWVVPKDARHVWKA